MERQNLSYLNRLLPLEHGRKVGAKRALKPRQVWAIRFSSTNTIGCATALCSI